MLKYNTIKNIILFVLASINLLWLGSKIYEQGLKDGKKLVYIEKRINFLLSKGYTYDEAIQIIFNNQKNDKISEDEL